MSGSGEHGYELLERIGIGGMAEVYRANALGAEGFERPIAIKRILPHLATDEDFVKMFIDEAKIAVQLSHPNIVGIFDLGRFGDDYFIAMELVHGRDLRQIQDREAQLGRRMPLEIALHAGMKVCEALHHAHFKGGSALMGEPVFIIHRDVSPQNVLVSYDGQVKVTDFGLAKAAGRAVQTQAGIIKGKLAYMSPEQLTTVPIDQRSDVFAAGTLLWEMLTGERLFLGKNDRETIQNVFKADVPSPRSLDPAIPVEIDRVVMKALAKDRDARYQTAQELHDDLEETGYLVNAMLGAPSVSAYMRALFPEAEVSGAGRKRDPRAATAEIRLSDVAGSGRASGQRQTFNMEPIPDEELDDDALEDEPEELDDSDVHQEPESIVPPAMLEDVAEDDEEESRKTVPPAGMADDIVTPMSAQEGMLHVGPSTESNREPGSALRVTQAITPGAGIGSGPAIQPAVQPGSGARAVMPKIQAPQPIIAPARPPGGVAAAQAQQYAAFSDDEYDDRTMFGGPRFDIQGDSSSPTLDFNGEQLAAQLEKLEALAGDTTGGNRLPPEELLTTKAHAPSGDLIARSRREREMSAAAESEHRPGHPDEAPSRDTIPPPDEYDDRTVVGAGANARPAPLLGVQEWEDETTPVGDEAKRRSR